MQYKGERGTTAGEGRDKREKLINEVDLIGLRF